MPTLILLVAVVVSSASVETSEAVLGVDDCVRIALQTNGRVFESEARVREYGARLAEVQALFMPRVQGIAILAPMYTVRGGIFHYQNEWRNLSDWGPYAHLEATLSQPLYTFGRAEAAKLAASERAEVERARLRETQNIIAWETRKLYFTYLHARSLAPTLADAHARISAALGRAEGVYASGNGDVGQADLSRLRFALAQVERLSATANAQATLALAALKHTMGIAAAGDLKLADDHLVPASDAPMRDLASYIADAAKNRPEWQQIAHGKRAARSLSEAEIKANLPVIAVAGAVNMSWTPSRANATNPYIYDPYNSLTGNVALAVFFDLNPWLAAAKQRTALAQHEQIEALDLFASTGIPLQVRSAWVNLEQAQRIAALASDSMRDMRTWVVLSANADATGVGEPRDLVESLASLIESRSMMYDALRDYYLASAELTYATGEH